MKQNKNNRFAALLLALCMAVCCALPALAAPAASANIDLSRTGSMDVTLYDHQNDVPCGAAHSPCTRWRTWPAPTATCTLCITADFTAAASRWAT